MTKPRTLCPDCGGPKPAGRGRKVCDACLAKRRPLVAERAAHRKAEIMKRRRRERRMAEGRPPFVRASDAPEGKKWCSRCQSFKDWYDFGKNTAKKDGLSTYCSDCYSAMLHRRNLLAAYDLSPEQYAAILGAQDGRCAICHNKPRTMRLAVDHNHKTGEIRGLLCKRCNQDLLGAGHEDPAILRRAAGYLEQPTAPRVLGTTVTVPEPVQEIDRIERAMQQAEIEAGNAGARWYAAILKRRRKPIAEAYVVLPLRLFAELLGEDGEAR